MLLRLIVLKGLGEEGEVDFTVVAMLPEVGVYFEGELAGMFENEDAVGGEAILLEDQVGQLGEILQRVWRVGEDDVEFLVGPFEEVKDIGAHHMEVIDVELLRRGLDKVDALGIDVDRRHFLGTARDELERDSTRAGEEVEDGTLVVIHVIIEDIEEALARHICHWTHGKVGRRIEATPPQCTSNNPHNIKRTIRRYDTGVYAASQER